MDKQTVVNVFNYLTADPQILSLLGLTLSTTPLEAELVEIDRRVCKTKQVGDVTDNKPRLAIWIETLGSFNRFVSRKALEVDILIPLAMQRYKGVAYDLSERIASVLSDKPLGTGVKNIQKLYDRKTAPGWYKASVRLTYNCISKY
jgi:hypothetical protein